MVSMDSTDSVVMPYRPSFWQIQIPCAPRFVSGDADDAVVDGFEVVLGEMGFHLFDDVVGGIVVPLHIRLLPAEFLPRIKLDDLAAGLLGFLNRLKHTERLNV